MKNRLFLSLTLLLSMALGPVGTGRLQAMEEEVNKKEKVINYYTDSDSEEEEEKDKIGEEEGNNINQQNTYTIKFQDEEFQVPEAVLQSIRQVWKDKDVLLENGEKGYSEKNPINITSLVENITKNTKDIKLFFDLVKIQASPNPWFPYLTTDELFVQLKLAHKLNCSVLINACAKELIGRISRNYNVNDAQLVEKMIDGLPRDLCDRKLKPILEERFASQLGSAFNKEKLTLKSTKRVNRIIKIDNNKIASSSAYEPIKLWNIETGTCTKTIEEDTTWVNRIIKIDNNKIASGSRGGTIKLCNLETGTCTKTLEGHKNCVNGIIKIDETTIASCSNDKTIKLWNLETKQLKKILEGHTAWVNCIIKIDENTIASGSDNGTIKLWNLKEGTCTKTIKGHTTWVSCIIKIDENTIASGSIDGTIKLWDKAGKYIKTLEGHENCVNGIIKIDETTIASCSNDKTIKLWDKAGKCIKTLEGHEGHVIGIIKIDENTIASYSKDKTIKLWNLKTGKCIKTFKGHTDIVNCIIKIDNDTIASCSDDKTIKLWDLNPFRDITFEQFEFCISLQKEYEKQEETVRLEEGKKGYEIFCSLPKNLQEKLVELGWVTDGRLEELF